MPLTIQDLGALGELLGSVAVLATLVYLALQMRQNTMAIAAQLDATRITNLVNLNLAGATSSELRQALAKDAPDLVETVSPTTQYWAAWLNTFQWQFVQSQRGVIPSYHEPGVSFVLQTFFRGSSGFGEFWDRVGRSAFVPEFVEWVEEQRSKAA